MKRDLLKLGGLIIFAAVAGIVFAWSGLYSVAATAGHWPVTSWLLGYTMRQSVETHALPLTAPPLAAVELIERGAGHYDGSCAPCHGAPGFPGNLVPKQMLPVPPYLPENVQPWTPEQLFWIVRHGLKYTGMPAWPAPEREDEVWAVTAFLLQLPTMSPEEYRRLAKGELAELSERRPGPAVAPSDADHLFAMEDAALLAACIRCHGTNGVGRPSGAFPRLDIQAPEYLFLALRDYASGVRASGIMEPIAAELGEAQSRRLAELYAGPPGAAAPPAGSGNPELLEIGARMAGVGAPDRQIAPCQSCHGLEAGPSNPEFPVLNGQYAGYIADQLRLWQAGNRGGTQAGIMDPIVANMTADEIEAVALYYAALPPPEQPAPPAGVPAAPQ